MGIQVATFPFRLLVALALTLALSVPYPLTANSAPSNGQRSAEATQRIETCTAALADLKALTASDLRGMSLGELQARMASFLGFLNDSPSLLRTYNRRLDRADTTPHPLRAIRLADGTPIDFKKTLDALEAVLEQLVAEPDRSSFYVNDQITQMAEALQTDTPERDATTDHFRSSWESNAEGWSTHQQNEIEEWERLGEVSRVTEDSEIVSIGLRQMLITAISAHSKPLDLIKINDRIERFESVVTSRTYFLKFVAWVNLFGTKDTDYVRALESELVGPLEAITQFFDAPLIGFSDEAWEAWREVYSDAPYPYDPILNEAARFGLLAALDSPESIAFVPKRQRDGQIFIAHPNFQLSLFLNKDGDLKSVWLRFEDFERWRSFRRTEDRRPEESHAAPRSIPQNGSMGPPLNGHAHTETQGGGQQAGPPEAEPPQAQPLIKVPLNIKPGVLTRGLASDFHRLNELYPGQHLFLESLVHLIENNRELRTNQARLREELTPILERLLSKKDHQQLPDAELSEALRQKLRTRLTNGHSSNGHRSTATSVDKPGQDLSLNALYDRYEAAIIDVLEADHAYEITFERESVHNSSVTRISFSKNVITFLQDSGEGDQWVVRVLTGFARNSADQGIKYIPKWDSANPYEYEVKRMRQNHRIIGRKLDDGTLYFEFIHTE